MIRTDKLTLLGVLLVAAVCALPSCSSSNRLDRSKAAEMIRRSPQFTHVHRMIIRHGSDRRYLDPVSPEETRQQGEARAVESWRDSYPYRAVLVELGLVEVKAQYVSTQMYGDREGRSTYDLQIRLTPRGEQLWRDLGLEVDPAAVPLARRKLLQITGITGGDAAKASRASAEFTWEWEPTQAGAAMTEGTAEFSHLPDRIKQMFESPESTPFPTFKSKVPLRLTGVRRGVANCQLFDDGWRLDSIGPLDNQPLNPID